MGVGSEGEQPIALVENIILAYILLHKGRDPGSGKGTEGGVDTLCLEAPVIGEFDIAPDVVNPVLCGQVEGVGVPVKNTVGRETLVKALFLNAETKSQYVAVAARTRRSVADTGDTVLDLRAALPLCTTGVAIGGSHTWHRYRHPRKSTGQNWVVYLFHARG